MSEAPALHFLHTILPHAPWEYLPDGHRSDKKLDFYTRHLLQVGLVDNLLGMTIERLKEQQLYDPSLIIVTADHGISFWPTTQIKNTNLLNDLQDVAHIPLFIKLPLRNNGKKDFKNIKHVDLLPTIADVIKIDLPFATDGNSILTGNNKRDFKTFLDSNNDIQKLPGLFPVKTEGLNYKIERYKNIEKWQDYLHYE